MKKISYIIFLLLFVIHVNAQENKPVTDFGKNEIKLNAAYLLAGGFELTYERNLSDFKSVGLAVLVPFEEDTFLDLNYMINPYFRFFFGNKPAQGFFVEGNASLASYSSVYYTFIDENNNMFKEIKDEFGLGLGIAVGGKFVLREQFVVEIYGGLGRYLNDIYYWGYPRLGITLGYRF